MAERAHAFIALRGEGVSLLLDVTDGRLPAVVHWGADVGELTADDVDVFRLNSVHPAAANIVDDPVRLPLLPEHWTGWVGRPGLSGSRGGRDWSPKFEATTVSVDGGADPGRRSARPGQRRHRSVHRGSILARLACTITVELAAGGWSGQAELTNRRLSRTRLRTAYWRSRCRRTPGDLDLAGRWGRAVPQRRARRGCTCARAARAGPGRRRRPPAPRAPGFGFATGEIWAVHTG